jgi:IS30 family transposase
MRAQGPSERPRIETRTKRNHLRAISGRVMASGNFSRSPQRYFVSHVERKSKYTKLAKLADNSADSVLRACARVLLPLADRIETITYDNGKEFASHAEIATSLGSLSYFAKPYHSWERGLNEHTNGLFRQYFPKGSDLSIVSDTDIQRGEDKLNSRPRKILGYRTPREVFFNAKNLRC